MVKIHQYFVVSSYCWQGTGFLEGLAEALMLAAVSGGRVDARWTKWTNPWVDVRSVRNKAVIVTCMDSPVRWCF